MTPVELPFDIWLRISQYIPYCDLRKMYSVNRAFFNISMDLRYSAVVLHAPIDHRRIQLLREPSVARRVRSLEFDLTQLAKAIFQPKRDILGAIKRILLPKSRSSKAQKLMSRHWFVKRVSQMHNVSSVRIAYNKQAVFVGTASDLPVSLPILKAGFGAFSHSLHTLTFQLPICAFRHIPMSSLGLPQLVNLNVTIRFCSITPDIGEKPIMENIAAFINQHHATLASLYLFCAGVSDRDITPLLYHIRHLPALRAVHIVHGLPIEDPTYVIGHRQFFKTHQESLTKLIVQIGFVEPRPASPDELPLVWAPPPHLFVPFRRLEDLTVVCRGDAWEMPALLTSLRDAHRSLTKLQVQDTRFSYKPLSEMLTPDLSHNGSALREHGVLWSDLRSLEMELFYLSPRILQLLASALPKLETLKLEFGNYWCNAAEVRLTDRLISLRRRGLRPGPVDVKRHYGLGPFAADLRHCSLGAWGLVHLVLSWSGSYTSGYRPTEFEQLVVRAMPSGLKTLNGVQVRRS